jgi:hypothetical protein
MRTGLASISIFAVLLSLHSPSQILTVAPDGTTRTSNLSRAEKTVLLPALQSATGESAANLLQSFTIFPEPLAEKGPDAIFAISVNLGCGAAHPNCMFLVFNQENGKDSLILNGVAGEYEIGSGRHNGYRDIVLKNYQGVHTMTSRWQYDGARYRVTTCIDEGSDGSRKQAPRKQCG